MFENPESSEGWQQVAAIQRSGADESATLDRIAEEWPVALVFNGISHPVVMTTPRDFTSFAAGFSLAEGIVQGVANSGFVLLRAAPLRAGAQSSARGHSDAGNPLRPQRHWPSASPGVRISKLVSFRRRTVMSAIRPVRLPLPNLYRSQPHAA